MAFSKTQNRWLWFNTFVGIHSWSMTYSATYFGTRINRQFREMLPFTEHVPHLVRCERLKQRLNGRR